MKVKSCPICKKKKLIIGFHKNNQRKDGLAYRCKDCSKKYLVKYKDRRKIYSRKTYLKYKEKILRNSKKRWRKERKIAFEIIANSKPIRCIKHEEWKCCGNPNNINCLSLDHIDGKGFIHRKEIKGGTIRLYRWVRRNPEKARKMLQILCMNAQMIKARLNKEVKNSKINMHGSNIGQELAMGGKFPVLIKGQLVKQE